MQISDESVSLAIDAARKHARDVMGVACEIEPETMRAALEAALGACKELPAAEVLERVAKDQLSDPSTDDMSVPLAIESVRLAQVVMNRDKCIEDIAGALKKTNARLYRLCECESESGYKDAALRDENSATLERWGLK